MQKTLALLSLTSLLYGCGSDSSNSSQYAELNFGTAQWANCHNVTKDDSFAAISNSCSKFRSQIWQFDTDGTYTIHHSTYAPNGPIEAQAAGFEFSAESVSLESSNVGTYEVISDNMVIITPADDDEIGNLPSCSYQIEIVELPENKEYQRWELQEVDCNEDIYLGQWMRKYQGIVSQ